MSRIYDFDPRTTGPSTRQKWQAFWSMYRLTRNKTMGMATGDWQVLLWHGPLNAWFMLAEYGDCKGPSDEVPWEYLRLKLRCAKTPERRKMFWDKMTIYRRRMGIEGNYKLNKRLQQYGSVTQG